MPAVFQPVSGEPATFDTVRAFLASRAPETTIPGLLGQTSGTFDVFDHHAPRTIKEDHTPKSAPGAPRAMPTVRLRHVPPAKIGTLALT